MSGLVTGNNVFVDRRYPQATEIPDKNKREFQIDHQTKNMERNIQLLFECIAALNNKLTKVMRTGESPTSGKESEISPETPLAVELFGFNISIETAIDNLRTIYSKVELGEL